MFVDLFRFLKYTDNTSNTSAPARIRTRTSTSEALRDIHFTTGAYLIISKVWKKTIKCDKNKVWTPHKFCKGGRGDALFTGKTYSAPGIARVLLNKISSFNYGFDGTAKFIRGKNSKRSKICY